MPKMAVVSKAFELCFCVIAADDCESAWIADLHLQAVSHLDVASKQSSGDADVQDDGVEARDLSRTQISAQTAFVPQRWSILLPQAV